MRLDNHIRSIVKTVIYRAVVSSILTIVTWTLTGNLTTVSTIVLVYNGAAVVFYYFHERLWSRIKWGTVLAHVDEGALAAASSLQAPKTASSAELGQKQPF